MFLDPQLLYSIVQKIHETKSKQANGDYSTTSSGSDELPNKIQRDGRIELTIPLAFLFNRILKEDTKTEA